MKLEDLSLDSEDESIKENDKGNKIDKIPKKRKKKIIMKKKNSNVIKEKNRPCL